MIDFVGIGAQKAGTTWLYKRLSMHPNIYFPRGKEIHYFDRLPENSTNIKPYADIFGNSHFYSQNKFKVGEITPEYAILSEKKISLLYDYSPEVRIFYSVRDPAERLWSAIKMHKFLQQKDIKKDRIEDILSFAKSSTFLEQSDYLNNIEKWRKYFHRKQICVVLFENFALHPHRVIKRVASHIGIDPNFYDLIPPKAIAAPIFTGHKASMPSEVREKFIELLDPVISGMEEELNTSLYSWRKVN